MSSTKCLVEEVLLFEMVLWDYQNRDIEKVNFEISLFWYGIARKYNFTFAIKKNRKI